MICPFWGHWVCEHHVTIISLWSTFCVLSTMRTFKKMSGPDPTFKLSRELMIIECLLCASYFTEHLKNVKSIISITLWQEFKIPVLPVEKTKAQEISITCLGSLRRWQSRAHPDSKACFLSTISNCLIGETGLDFQKRRQVHISLAASLDLSACSGCLGRRTI